MVEIVFLNGLNVGAVINHVLCERADVLVGLTINAIEVFGVKSFGGGGRFWIQCVSGEGIGDG